MRFTRKFRVAGVLIGLLVCSQAAVSGETDSDKVRTFAEGELMAQLRGISPAMLEDFGFHDERELRAATVAAPLQMSTIRFPNPATAPASDRMSAFTEVHQYWYVPIRVGKEYRSILEVRRSSEGYQVVGIGAAGLAKVLGSWYDALETGHIVVPGGPEFSTYYVNGLGTDLDFVGVRTTGEEYFWPLPRTRETLGLQENKLFAQGEIVPRIEQRLMELAREIE